MVSGAVPVVRNGFEFFRYPQSIYIVNIVYFQLISC